VLFILVFELTKKDLLFTETVCHKMISTQLRLTASRTA